MPAAHAAYPDRTIVVARAVRAGRADRHHRAHPGRIRSARSLKQSVIVENRPGAAGNLGMGVAARATPDGYTLLLTSTAIAVNPALFKKLPYDPFKDFAPISELVDSPNIIVVQSQVRHQHDCRAGRARQGRAQHVQLFLARRRHQIEPDRRGTQAARRHRDGAHSLSRRGSRRGRGAGRHGAGRLGGAAGGGGDGAIRSAQGAGGHRTETLVFHARRADHDRVRLSRLRLGDVLGAVRAGRNAARDCRLAVEAVPRSLQQRTRAEDGARRRLRSGRRSAGSADGADEDRDSGGSCAGRTRAGIKQQ